MSHATRHSFQPEHILHVVNSGLLVHDPLRRAESAAREDTAIARFMRELHALTEGGKHDGVVADDIAAPQRVDTNLGRSAFAGDALPTVTQRLGRELALLENDFEESRGG